MSTISDICLPIKLPSVVSIPVDYALMYCSRALPSDTTKPVGAGVAAGFLVIDTRMYNLASLDELTTDAS